LKSSSADRDKAGAACKRFNDVWRSSDGSTWTRIRHVYVLILLLLVELLWALWAICICHGYHIEGSVLSSVALETQSLSSSIVSYNMRYH
jgi:hypothetical protein